MRQLQIRLFGPYSGTKIWPESPHPLATIVQVRQPDYNSRFGPSLYKMPPITLSDRTAIKLDGIIREKGRFLMNTS